jgi:hypothetical protein
MEPLGFTIKLDALLAVALLAGVLAGGTLTIDPSWSAAESAAFGLVTLAAVIAARVMSVRADAARNNDS